MRSVSHGRRHTSVLIAAVAALAIAAGCGSSAPSTTPGASLEASASAAASATPLASPSPSPIPAIPPLALVPILPAGSLQEPIAFTSLPDGRLLVVERIGRVRVIKGGSLVATPLLDIRGRVRSGYQEEGLLGIAVNPGYPADPRIFVTYTRPDLSLRLSSFVLPSGSDTATPAEMVILTIPHPTNQNHNGGMIAFGPDGYLYLGTGDGGSGGDPPNNAQSRGSLLGKMLRLDVNHGGALGAYSIPADNPYIGTKGARAEIWAVGLRNPWRFSFDRATGDLWIGDVGQDSWEEIDRATAASGLARGMNFGWSCLEATHTYRADRCASGTIGLTSPVTEYAHGSNDSVGCAVTGGYVYRGTAIPGLVGRYIFGDYCTGRTWSIASDAPTGTAPQPLLSTGLNISAFGQDAAGELYLVDLRGTIYRLAAAG